MGYVLSLAAVATFSLHGAEWKQLFNGKNLDGWKHVGPGGMTVENGVIQTHGGMGCFTGRKEN